MVAWGLVFKTQFGSCAQLESTVSLVYHFAQVSELQIRSWLFVSLFCALRQASSPHLPTIWIKELLLYLTRLFLLS